MSFTLKDFVRESNRIEGIHREPSEREMNAHEWFLGLHEIDIESLQTFVGEVQPGAVLRDKSHLNVRVGQHIAPQGGKAVVIALQHLLDSAQANICDHRSCFEIHYRYETLHPFTDGNGRSGRALWLWMHGGIDGARLGFLHHWYYESLAYGKLRSISD